MDDFGNDFLSLGCWSVSQWDQWLISITAHGGIDYACGVYCLLDPL